MLIEIRKVSRDEKKDRQNNVVVDPLSQDPVRTSPSIGVELVRTEDIRNAVEWHSDELKSIIGGDITCLYMDGGAKVLIHESIDSFATRSEAIRLETWKTSQDTSVTAKPQ